MIIATAGHIDHGKTALVRALTGADTDRLPEEKARGITIDLGFAFLPLPGGGVAGFIDVPGHERLVRTMLAGASGVDLALLVVAADDGVMPQTLEHIAVLDLLGVRQAVVALSKADRAGSERRAEAAEAVGLALAGTGLRGAPVIACSSVTGEGIPAVVDHLRRAALAVRARDGGGGFRLAVDRSFILPGAGLIATGTVHAGRVEAGDRLTVSPAGIGARVRGLHVHDRAAAAGSAGQRVAVNLAGAGVEKRTVRRGDWLVAPSLHRPTDRLDVRLRLLPSEPRALRHWTPVHVHLGTAALMGRAALLEAGRLEPGGEAMAQLVLDVPVAALWGDRFVIRDASGQRTIGGGRVLDPFALKRRGRGAERGAMLAAHGHEEHGEALRALLRQAEAGVELDQFQLARNLGDAEAAAFGGLFVLADVAGSRQRLAVSRERWAALQDRLLGALREHHERHPDSWGATVEELGGALAPPIRALAASAVRALLDQGRVQRSGRLLHLPGREVRLLAGDAVLWEAARALFERAGLGLQRVSAVAETLGMEADGLRALFETLARIGWLLRVSSAYYVLPGVAARLAGLAREAAGANADGRLTVGQFREATGLTRHATMPVLEFFDRIGLTRRVHEGRVLNDGWGGFDE